MRYLIFLLALTLPGAASAQECLTELDCHICFKTDGTLAISDCGSPAGSACPPFPASLLVADPAVEPGSLHALLVARGFALWKPGEPIYDVLTDPNRLFIRREMMSVVLENPAAVGSGLEFLQGARIGAKELLVQCLGYLEAFSTADGTGGTKYTVGPRSGASRGPCSGPLLGWIPERLGPFTRDELAPFVRTRSASVMGAKAEAQEELLVGLAAQLRELSPEDRREVLDHAALMGTDLEGGRE